MSKHYFIFVLALFPLWGAAQINLSVQHYTGDAILAKYVQGKAYPVDTLKGKGSYSCKGELEKGIYLFLLGEKYLEFPVGSDKNFSLGTDHTKELLPAMKVEGSTDNSLFQNYLLLKSPEQKQAFLTEKLSQVKDPFFRAYMQALKPIDASHLKNDTTTFYYSRRHFWDNTDLTLPEMLNSPLVTGKMQYYFKRMFVQQPDTVIRAITEFMTRPMADTVKHAALSFLLPYTFENKVMGMEKAFVWLAENYFVDQSTPWIDAETKKTIREQYLLNKYCLVGEKGHNLELTKLDGTPFNLYEQSGDYTLLLFYDISCSSCKEMVWSIAEKSTELFLKGVDIVALNTEKEEDKWKSYIGENSISDWTHVMDIHDSSNYHTLYGVQMTPTLYLLDRDKNIIGKKLSVDQVLQLIDHDQNLSSL